MISTRAGNQPLYPDDLGEIITHGAKRTAQSVKNNRPSISGGPFCFKIALSKGRLFFLSQNCFVIFVFFVVKYNRLVVDFA